MISFNEVARALLNSRWIYAKTMPQAPHHYTLRKEWKHSIAFEDVVQYIRDHGYREKFSRSYYTRLNINGRKYWSMGAPLPATILINRADIDAPTAYDAIARTYDLMWDTPEAREENDAVAGLIGCSGGSVLDIGCGTGLFLDMHGGKIEDYHGIDPSRRMLARLREKHGGDNVHTLPTTFESYFTERKFDLVVSLFGAASYVQPTAWARLPELLAPAGRAFLMFYRPGYNPVTHVTGGIDLPIYEEGPAWIAGSTVRRFKEFNITELHA